MDNLYWLDQIQPSEQLLVGDKAFNLSQLLQRGYPVVPGFVVPATASGSTQGAIAFWEFIEILGKSEPLLADLPHSSFHLDVDNPRQLQQVAQQIRQVMTVASLPPLWASTLLTAAEEMQAPAMIFHPSGCLPLQQLQVSQLLAQRSVAKVKTELQVERSSQFSAFELSKVDLFGILESHICLRQPDALTLCLKRVWAELFRARSLFYCQRQGIGLQQVSLAVLVQPIWNAIASGTIEADPRECKIQATWGLGITIAKGEVLPDSYQLDMATGRQTQALGSKTRAYRLSNVSVPPLRSENSSFDALGDRASSVPLLPQEAYIPTVSGLQAYILTEEQQNQYALEEKYLKQLIELSQQLTAELDHAFSLEWAIYQIPGSLEPQLRITQFSPHPINVSSHRFMSTQPPTSSNISPQLVRGLPAATGRATAPAQVISNQNPNLETILPGRILIAQSVAPDWLPLLKLAAGVVTEQGGMTSHAAILARELGIPAIVGAANVTQLFQTGEILMVDGNQGEIHRVKDLSPELERSQQLNTYSPLFPIATQLLVNLSQTASLERVAGMPVDGVGLLRSELMMLDALENLHPTEWLRQGLKGELVARLSQSIIKFAAAFTPRAVFYRSLDWRSHEFQFLMGSTSAVEPEVNPIIGMRGTRRILNDSTYFDLELAALQQVHSYGYTNVQLLLPFVRTVEEFTFCRRRVEQAGLTENPHFQLWIMAEVPSVLFLLPDYVKAGVQGISIGTNDLTQLLLAADRDQGQLGSVLDGNHPAVRRALKQLIEIARSAGIPCSICGQAPTLYPELIDSLVQWGITSISVDITDVEQTYMAIARAEQRLLLEAARQRINTDT